MLYIFAGFPKCGLNAGGIRLFTQREEIGDLEESNNIQLRKEGAFILTDTGEERLGDIEYRLSDNCALDGIGWRWFPEDWAFGNGVTVHKTTAQFDQGVIYEDGYVLQARADGKVDLSRVPQGFTEGWEKYEARYDDGKCLRENHVVHLTWCVFQHDLPEHAYERLRSMIEVPDYQLGRTPYENADEPGKYISATRALAFPKQAAIPAIPAMTGV